MSKGEVELVLLAMIAAVIAMTIKAYRLAAGLGLSAPPAWALGFLMPCVDIVLLLTISSYANRRRREFGLPVGLFGPDGDAVDASAARHAPHGQ